MVKLNVLQCLALVNSKKHKIRELSDEIATLRKNNICTSNTEASDGVSNREGCVSVRSRRARGATIKAKSQVQIGEGACVTFFLPSLALFLISLIKA